MQPNQEMIEEAREVLSDAETLRADISEKHAVFVERHEENDIWNKERGLPQESDDARPLYYEEIERLDRAGDDLRDAISVVKGSVTSNQIDEDAIRDFEEDVSSARNHFDEVGPAPQAFED